MALFATACASLGRERSQSPVVDPNAFKKVQTEPRGKHEGATLK